MTLKKSIWTGVVTFFAVCVMTQANPVQAADPVKIGVMNVQKILSLSTVGQKAKVKVEEKIKGLQAKFKTEEEELNNLQKEIEKKSSAWSKEKKDEKVREFKKMRRELQAKSEDARFEVKQLQDKELGPILKQLEKIVEEYGSKNGYAIIFDIKSGVIYFHKAVDVSDEIITALNSATK